MIFLSKSGILGSFHLTTVNARRRKIEIWVGELWQRAQFGQWYGAWMWGLSKANLWKLLCHVLQCWRKPACYLLCTAHCSSLYIMPYALYISNFQ